MLIEIALPIARSGYNLERSHFQLIILPLPIARYGYNLEVHLDPCAFDFTKFDEDWFKLNLEDFEPLAAMLFCQSN